VSHFYFPLFLYSKFFVYLDFYAVDF
jgi:hypothetical protein